MCRVVSEAAQGEWEIRREIDTGVFECSHAIMRAFMRALVRELRRALMRSLLRELRRALYIACTLLTQISPVTFYEI